MSFGGVGERDDIDPLLEDIESFAVGGDKRALCVDAETVSCG